MALLTFPYFLNNFPKLKKNSKNGVLFFLAEMIRYHEKKEMFLKSCIFVAFINQLMNKVFLIKQIIL